MPIRFSLSSVVLILALATAARAHWGHSVGRYLGMGWGDGYHAQNAYPPRRAAYGYGAGPREQPWWMTPATPPAIALPHSSARSSPSAYPSGPSLFRQPGEGSSVLVTEGPASQP